MARILTSSEWEPKAKSSTDVIGVESPVSSHTGAAAGPASRSDVILRQWCRMYGCSKQPANGSQFCSNHQHAANEHSHVLPDPGRKQPSTFWTREMVIEAIQEWARRHDGTPPTCKDWGLCGEYHPTSWTAAKRFDGWRDAIRAAGFEPRQRWQDAT